MAKKRYKRKTLPNGRRNHQGPLLRPIPSRKEADSKQYKDWRQRVIRRDGRVCRMPGCGSKRLTQVHHIKRFADVPHGRYDVTNGIVLCAFCHKRITNNEEFYAPILLKLVSERMPGRASLLTSIIMNRFADDQLKEED